MCFSQYKSLSPQKSYSLRASQSGWGVVLEGLRPKGRIMGFFMLLCYLYPIVVFHVDRNVDAHVEVRVSSAMEN